MRHMAWNFSTASIGSMSLLHGPAAFVFSSHHLIFSSRSAGRRDKSNSQMRSAATASSPKCWPEQPQSAHISWRPRSAAGTFVERERAERRSGDRRAQGRARRASRPASARVPPECYYRLVSASFPTAYLAKRALSHNEWRRAG
jgi:hypothetical protein